MDLEKMDDPIWEYTLGTKLLPYIPAVREFWSNIENIKVFSTGVFSIEGDNVPPGLMYRVTNTPVRSPIKHVQVFPFVPTTYLQLTNITGGAVRMVARVCRDNKFKIEEFTIIEKSNLPSVYHQGQFVAFVPTKIIENITELGKWVYLTMPEMLALLKCEDLPQSVLYKIKKYC